MDALPLENRFSSAKQRADVRELQEIVQQVEIGDPHYWEYVHCWAHTLGQQAKDDVQRNEAIIQLERVGEWASDPVLRAKAWTNLAHFCIAGNAIARAKNAAERALSEDLSEGHQWIHVIARYNLAHAYWKQRDYPSASEHFRAVLTMADPAYTDRARVALANLAAYEGDEQTVYEHLQHVDDVTLIPHITGVRAHLAYTQGAYGRAHELTWMAINAFLGAPNQAQPELLDLVDILIRVDEAVGYQKEAATLRSWRRAVNDGFDFEGRWRDGR